MHDSFSVVSWRDSVCAGDDGDAPHELKLELPLDESLRDFVSRCTERRYLASISGGKATWILEAGRPLAVIAQQWSEPKFLVASDAPIFSLIDQTAKPHLNFRYCCQIDPERSYTHLARGELASTLKSLR